MIGLLRLALQSFKLLALLIIITGFIYPLAITGIGNLFFASDAQGSLIYVDGTVVGSEHIGQNFDSPEYFWGRPSSTGSFPYNPGYSSGSNLGPTNPALIGGIETRMNALQESDPAGGNPAGDPLIPIDLVTASGSGLDPDISLLAARYQAPRIASSRGLPVETIYSLIDSVKEDRQFGFLGEPHVNVLLLNLALDEIQ